MKCLWKYLQWKLWDQVNFHIKINIFWFGLSTALLIVMSDKKFVSYNVSCHVPVSNRRGFFGKIWKLGVTSVLKVLRGQDPSSYLPWNLIVGLWKKARIMIVGLWKKARIIWPNLFSHYLSRHCFPPDVVGLNCFT